MFNRWQAQRWWAENYDKVMELYNVQIFNRQSAPLPIPPRSEDEVIVLGFFLFSFCFLFLTFFVDTIPELSENGF